MLVQVLVRYAILSFALEPSYADAWAERGLLDLRKRDLEQAEP